LTTAAEQVDEQAGDDADDYEEAAADTQYSKDGALLDLTGDIPGRPVGCRWKWSLLGPS
jgi:hypothetical protein